MLPVDISQVKNWYIVTTLQMCEKLIYCNWHIIEIEGTMKEESNNFQVPRKLYYKQETYKRYLWL